MDRKILIFFAVVVGMGLGGHLIYGQKSQYFRSEVPEKRFALPQPNSQSATQLTPPPQASSGGATVLLDDKATGAKLSVGGVGHARYVFAKEGDSYPMTRALDSEFTFKAQPNKHLTVDFRAQLIRTNMDAQPPSANTFVPRMALSWVNEIADPELTQSITRVGDLRRLTLGKGLFFKDLESEGITTELKGRTQSITGTYVSRAYTEKSDLGILDWANANRT
ncbi:hypothetical protein EBR96_03795, partial [bacterium]|nr:hypothetical protein [bacterium]